MFDIVTVGVMVKIAVTNVMHFLLESSVKVQVLFYEYLTSHLVYRFTHWTFYSNVTQMRKIVTNK